MNILVYLYYNIGNLSNTVIDILSFLTMKCNFYRNCETQAGQNIQIYQFLFASSSQMSMEEDIKPFVTVFRNYQNPFVLKTSEMSLSKICNVYNYVLPIPLIS